MVDDTERRLAELERRVAGLERSEAAPPPPAAVARRLAAELQGDAGRVVYAGAVPWEAGVVAWEMDRAPDELLPLAEATAMPVFAALASPTRIRIVAELMAGPVATGELAQRLHQPSSGQLFHHLKELLATGLVHQPVRGTYALRRQHVVPLLAVLSAAVDLAPPAPAEPS